MDLTDTDRAMLDLEGELFKYLGAKEATVRQRFGLSLVQFNARVLWLIEQPAALAYAPATVRRLQRLRDRRLAARGQVWGRAG